MDKIKIAYNRGYRVSHDGEVSNPKGFKLKNILANNGYYKFNIRVDGKTKQVDIHRLQAYQKYGDKMFGDGIMVRHLDSDPKNNSKGNIAIGTATDNRMDITPSIRKTLALKAAEKTRKYDKELVKEHYQVNGWTKTMRHFGISSKGTLSYIINS